MNHEKTKFELEDYSRLLVSSIADCAVVTLDLNGCILSWNDGAQRLSGYTSEEIIGQHFSRFYTEKDRAAGKPDDHLEIAKSKGDFEDRGWRVRKDGEQFFANVKTSALTDQTGKLRAFGEVTRDLTVQHLSEQKLKEQLEIINLTHETIMIRGLNGAIQFWNKGAEEMYGFTEAEALGQICHDLLQTEFPKARKDIEAEVLAQGRWDGELIHRSRRGVAVTVMSRWALKVDANGQPSSFLEIDRDINERKSAEQKGLRDKEDRELRVKERIIELAASDELLSANAIEIERSDEERELRVQERIVELAASDELLRSKTMEIERSDEERELRVQERIIELAASDELLSANAIEIERSDEERELRVQERIVELAASEKLLRSKTMEIERSDEERELRVQERIVELAASEELLRSKTLEIERSDEERELRVKERFIELAASEELLRSKTLEIEKSDEERELRVQERIVELAASEELLRSKTLELEKSDEERELRVQERIVELAASEELLRSKTLELEKSDEERELRVQERIVELAASEKLLRSKTLEIEKSDEERELRVQERIIELAASEKLLRSKTLEIEKSDEERELRVQERIIELAASEKLLRSKVMEIEKSDEERELRVQERIVELAASEKLLRSKVMEIEKSDEERELRVQERIVELAASEKLLRSKVMEIERSDKERELRVQERIVELAASEELLRSKVMELERSNEELQQFAYVCSHDLQEPLRVIANYTQLLSRRYKGQIDDKADTFIAFAVDASKRMQDLINDLLAYSRLQTIVRSFDSVNCMQVVEMALANLEILLTETGATVHYDSLPIVEGDQSQLLQLFQNLISNALKFRSKEAVVIDISARQDDGSWLFAVRDNGIGFDMQFEDRIFLIFQRLHTKEEYSGSGIGLAVCKKIVLRHGGRIWVESELGKGAIFFFTIPALISESQHG